MALARLWLRRSAALKLLPVAVLMMWTLGRDEVKERYYWADAAVHLTRAAVLMVPLACAAVAWDVATRRRFTRESAGVGRGVGAGAWAVAAAVAIIGLPYLVLCVSVVLRLDVIRPLEFAGLALLGLGPLVAFGAIGAGLGSVLPRSVGAAAGALGGYVWVGWLAVIELPVRHLSFQLVMGLTPWEGLPRRVTAAHVLAIAGLLVIGLGMLTAQWHRWAIVPCLAVGGPLLLLAANVVQPVGLWPRGTRSLRSGEVAACEWIGTTKACAWPEDGELLRSQVPTLRKLLEAVDDTAWGAPGYLSEQNLDVPEVVGDLDAGRRRMTTLQLASRQGHAAGPLIADSLLPAMPACGLQFSGGVDVYGYPGLTIRNHLMAWLVARAGRPDFAFRMLGSRDLDGFRKLLAAPEADQIRWFDRNVQSQLDCTVAPESFGA